MRDKEEGRETDCIMSKLFDAITKLLAKGRGNFKQQERERMNSRLKKERNEERQKEKQKKKQRRRDRNNEYKL